LKVPGARNITIPHYPEKSQLVGLGYSIVSPPNITHQLFVEWDAGVHDTSMWNNKFLQYDFIGAPWWYDELNVGNGGFSLRSRWLCDILHNDEKIVPTNDRYIKNFEEDHNLSKIYRKYLEETYGIKFAPIEVADKFSIEVYGVWPPGNKYKGSFGFHGYNNIDWSGAKLEHIPKPQKQFAR